MGALIINAIIYIDLFNLRLTLLYSLILVQELSARLTTRRVFGYKKTAKATKEILL